MHSPKIQRRTLLALALLCAVRVFAIEQLIVGPNVNVSKRVGYEAEVAVAVNPTNPQKAFVLSGTAGGSLFGGVSADGGAIWTTRLVATGADGITAAGSHPSAAFDAFGNLFIAYTNAASSAVVVARSIDSGVTFVPVTTFAGTIDHPRLTTGPSSVWVTYQSGTNVVARGAAVTGLGTVGAFSPEQTATTSTGGSFADLAVGQGGKVAVGYQIAVGAEGPSTMYANVDADGLGTGGFGTRRTVATTNVGGADHVPAQPGHGANAAVGLAWDRTGGLHNNRLYMVYTEEATNESNDFDILLRYSDNDGVTWSTPVLLNEELAGTQMLPRIALDPVTGHIAVVWLSAHNDPANTAVELWGTASTDGGETFLANVQISEGASNGTAAAIGNAGEFGDYVGLTFYDGVLIAGWADSSNATGNNPDGTAGLDLYVARVTLTNPDVLTLSTASGLNSSGLVGGPFTPVSQAYTLTNTATNPVNWTVTKTQPWVTLTASGGTLAAGGTTTVTVSLDASVSTFAPGTYADTVTFTNTTSGVSQTRPVRLVVTDPLALSPTIAFAASGTVGGPFTPASQIYTLTNRGTTPITWSAAKAQPWVNVSGISGTLAGGANATVTVSINAVAAAVLAPGAYSDTVSFTDTTTGFVQSRGVALTVNPPPPDYFTELFDFGRPNDTANQSWIFTPDASSSAYSVLRVPATVFPTDPTGGTTLTLTDDSNVTVTLTGTARVKLYGTTYASFFVGSNGYVTFVTGDTEYNEALSVHFLRARIAALLDDLNPSVGGKISWKQLTDRAVVTYENVPEFSTTNSNNFQIEMFYDGRIRITILGLAATDGLIGLSRGLGTPADFSMSDFSTYPAGTTTLEVSPAGGFISSVEFGGTPQPPSATYTLTNTGNLPLSWTAAKTAPWLTLSATGGTLAAGASAPVTATIAAGVLEPGNYSDTLTFTNTTNGVGNTTRGVGLTVTLGVPVLVAEPAFTGGPSNTVAWSGISGATAYEIQRATAADFSDAASFGPVVGLSRAFSGLTEGTLYRYRVRARRALPGSNGAWTQTTQGDFNMGTKDLTDTTTAGDVVLATASGIPLGGRVANPSFESGTLVNWTATTNSSGMSSRSTNGTAFLPMPTAGTYYAAFNTFHNTARTAGEYARILQDVELTGVSALIFDAVLGASVGSTWSGSVRAELRVDGVALWSSTTAGASLNKSIDVSAYSGIHTIELREEVIVSGTYNAQWLCFDNFRAIGNGYPAAGSIVSSAIAPGTVYRWNNLTFTRNTAAAGTALTVDVLATDGVSLATNVASGTNLNTIPAVAGQPALLLRANLSTTVSTNTPRLSDWTVNYQLAAGQDALSAWSIPVSSIQDVTSPILTVASGATPTTGVTGTFSDISGLATLLVNGLPVTAINSNGTFVASAATLSPGPNVITFSATDNAVPANTTSGTANVFFFVVPGDVDADGLPDLWEIENGLDMASAVGDQGALGDLDRDGIPNLLELAFGQRANVADSGGLPVASVAINPVDGLRYLILKYHRLLAPGSLLYSLELSNDLQSWIPATVAGFELTAPPSSDAGGKTETVTLRIRPSLAAPGNVSTHLRVRVTVPVTVP